MRQKRRARQQKEDRKKNRNRFDIPEKIRTYWCGNG